MKISNILEITPELKRDILWTLRTASILGNHLKGLNSANLGGYYFHINISNKGHSYISIYDRQEGELGYYTHEFREDGSYKFDFVKTARTPEAEMFDKAFTKEFNPASYELMYGEDSDE